MKPSYRDHREDIHAYCLPRLKALAVAEANKRRIPLSELLVKALVAYIGAPDELAAVPRLPIGRPVRTYRKSLRHAPQAPHRVSDNAKAKVGKSGLVSLD